MNNFRNKTLLALSLFTSAATLLQAPPKQLEKKPQAEIPEDAPAQMTLDTGGATASAADDKSTEQPLDTLHSALAGPELPASGVFGTAEDASLSKSDTTPLARRKSSGSETEKDDSEEKTVRRPSFGDGVHQARINLEATQYHYQKLQELIAEHEANEPVMAHVRKLATRTGDYCLLFEIVRHDIHKLRNISDSSLTPEQKQTLMTNMLSHYILTICESMILVANLSMDESQAFAGWEIINSIYMHWFNKYLVTEAKSTIKTFSLEALITAALDNCRSWFEQEKDEKPSFTGVPHAVTWFKQTTFGYGIASVYTYNIAFSGDSTVQKKDEIRAISLPGVPHALKNMRLTTLTHVEDVLKTKSLESLFAVRPEEIASKILGDRSASPLRHIE